MQNNQFPIFYAVPASGMKKKKKFGKIDVITYHYDDSPLFTSFYMMVKEDLFPVDDNQKSFLVAVQISSRVHFWKRAQVSSLLVHSSTI